MPAGVLPAAADGWTIAKYHVANDALADGAVGRRVRVRVAVRKVELAGDDAAAGYAVSYAPVDAQPGGAFTTEATGLTVTYAGPRAVDAARLQVGDEAVLVGTLTAATFEEGHSAADVTPAVLKLSFENPTVESAAPRPTTRPADRVQSVAEFFAALPAGVRPTDWNQWTDAKVAVANREFAKRPAAAVRLTIKTLDVTNPNVAGPFGDRAAPPASAPAVSYVVTTDALGDPAWVDHVELDCVGDLTDFAARLAPKQDATVVVTVTAARLESTGNSTDGNGVVSHSAKLVLTVTRATVEK